MQKRIHSVLTTAILLASCGPAAPGPKIYSSGHLGEASSGSAGNNYAFSTPFFQEDDRMTIALTAEYPDHPRHTVALILLRLPSAMSLSASNRSGSDGERLHWRYEIGLPSGGTYPIQFEIPRDPPSEKLTFGGEPAALEDNRVFLIDLTASPATVVPLKVDLMELVPEEKPTVDGLKAAAGKLREKYESVRKLWP